MARSSNGISVVGLALQGIPWADEYVDVEGGGFDAAGMLADVRLTGSARSLVLLAKSLWNGGPVDLGLLVRNCDGNRRRHALAAIASAMELDVA